MKWPWLFFSFCLLYFSVTLTFFFLSHHVSTWFITLIAAHNAASCSFVRQVPDFSNRRDLILKGFSSITRTPQHPTKNLKFISQYFSSWFRPQKIYSYCRHSVSRHVVTQYFDTDTTCVVFQATPRNKIGRHKWSRTCSRFILCLEVLYVSASLKKSVTEFTHCVSVRARILNFCSHF